MQGEGQLLEQSDSRSEPDGGGALLAAVATGDREAFSALYDQHSRAVFGLAKRMVGPGAAEDLVHDVFLEVWHHACDYAPERGSVRAWLMVRARSRALDRLGKRARDARVTREVNAQTSVAGDPWTSGLHESRVDAHRVGQLVNQLEPELARVLDLAYFEGLSCSEIADQLALPIGTVKSRLARALSRLRAAVGFQETEDSHG